MGISAATGWADGLLVASGWVLLAVGGLLLLWALFGDRSRGRKRCPKCWYDMSGAVARSDAGDPPVYTCPECGRVVKGERGLERTRRRWSWVVVATLPLVASHVLFVQYRVPAEGWGAYIPSWPLVLGSRWFIEDEVDRFAPGWGPLAHTRSETKDMLFELLHGRAIRNDLSNWQWSALARLALGVDHGRLLAVENSWGRPYGFVPILKAGLGHGALSKTLQLRIESLAGVVIKTRNAWPQGERVFAEIEVYQFQAESWEVDLRAEFVPRTAGGRTFIYRSRGEVSHGFTNLREPVDFGPRLIELGVADDRGRLEFDVTITGAPSMGHYRASVEVRPLKSATEVLSPIRMEQWESSGSRPALISDAAIMPRRAGPRLELSFDRNEIPWLDAPTIALEAEVFRDGTLVYRGQGCALPSRAMRPGMPVSGVWIPLAAIDGHTVPPETRGVWTVRLRGDPVVALRHFGASTYWDGEMSFDVPYRVSPAAE